MLDYMNTNVLSDAKFKRYNLLSFYDVHCTSMLQATSHV